jgi:hypothetical protein
VKGSGESLLAAAAKLSPPVGVVVTAAAGFNWQTLVWQLTAAYTAVMLCKLLWDWIIHPYIKRRQKD